MLRLVVEGVPISVASLVSWAIIREYKLLGSKRYVAVGILAPYLMLVWMLVGMVLHWI